MEQENVKKKTSPVTWLVLIVFVIIVAAVIDTASKAEPRAMQDTDRVVSRCLSVPESITRRLNDGLNIEGGSVANFQAVKSNDFESVYFVSGILQGPGLGRDADLITFVTNKLDSSEAGLTFSAGAVSTEFSDWPDISTTNLGVTMGDDGYDESRECVSNS